jgi:hypothetical protein
LAQFLYTSASALRQVLRVNQKKDTANFFFILCDNDNDERKSYTLTAAQKAQPDGSQV